MVAKRVKDEKGKCKDQKKVKKAKIIKQMNANERPPWDLYSQPPNPKILTNVHLSEREKVVDRPQVKTIQKLENVHQGQGQGHVKVKVRKKKRSLSPHQPRFSFSPPPMSSRRLPLPPFPRSRPPPTPPRNEESNYSFGNLVHQKATALDIELKNVLMRDSINATIKTTESQASDAQKLNLLDIARTEAQICEVIRMLEEDGDDPEDEVTCCFNKRTKKRKDILELGENDIDNEDKITTGEIWMRRVQRVMKWGVVVTAAFDFFLAVDDIYKILLRQMQIEYLFLIQIYNCDALIGGGYSLIIWTNVIHCIFCVGLLFVKNKATCGFALYWGLSQIFIIVMMLVEAFFRSRFKPRDTHTLTFLSFIYWRLPLDLFQLSIVIFRYYKLDNPFPERLKAIAADARLDRSLNNELRLRNSPFLQSKYRMREAAAFQTLEIIRKVEQCVKASGMRSRKNIIESELRKALHVLHDPKKYPKKQTIAQAQMKKEKLDDDDEVTIFQPTTVTSKNENAVGDIYTKHSNEIKTKDD